MANVPHSAGGGCTITGSGATKHVERLRKILATEPLVLTPPETDPAVEVNEAVRVQPNCWVDLWKR